MWPKTTHLLPVWPMDDKRLDSPGLGFPLKLWLALQEIQNTNMKILEEKLGVSHSIKEAIYMANTRALMRGTQVTMGEIILSSKNKGQGK